MGILGIVGSPRKGERSDALVQAALDGAAAAGALVQKTYLIDWPIRRFDGSGGFASAFDYCPVELSRLWNEADAVVLVAPVYWGDINGLTKDFMDSVRPCRENGKPALGAAIAGGSGKGLISGAQSIYHFFYHRQLRAIDPIAVSRFNMETALEQMYQGGARLFDLVGQPSPFVGASRDACWGQVVAYYEQFALLRGDPLDEFLLLDQSLLSSAVGQSADMARKDYEEALRLAALGRREEAAPLAVACYQRLYY